MVFRFKLLCVKVLIGFQNLLLAMLYAALFKRGHLHTEPRTILVYRTARLGDFICAIPALVALRRRFPRARIVLLTTASTLRSMRIVTKTYSGPKGTLLWLSLVAPSLVDEAVVFSLEDWKSGIGQARRCVRDLQPEVTFILPFSGEGATNRAKKLLFLWLAGVRGPVYGRRVFSTMGFMRETQYQAGLFPHQVIAPLRAIDECPLIPYQAEEQDVAFHIALDRLADAWAANLWAQEGWEKARVVAIFPGGTFPHKRWPVTKFAELCTALYEQWGVQLVIIGAATDTKVCEQLSRELRIPHMNLAGQTTVDQLASLLSRCCLFVGNDSGPSHLASAVGCPSVTLTSSIEYPGLWEPWNSRKHAIRHWVPCEHCFSFTECPLGTRECIERIEVSRVIALCQTILEEDHHHENMAHQPP